eukprot:UN29339
MKDIDDEKIAPPEVIERVWTAIMMRPKAYTELCNIMVNELVDYNPDVTREEERLTKTLNLYKEFFKREPTLGIWVHDIEDEEEPEEEEENENIDENDKDAVQNALRKSLFKQMKVLIHDGVHLTKKDLFKRFGSK